MTPRPETLAPDLDAIASQWIARRDHGLTSAEQSQLAAWLAKPPHAEAFSRCEAMWNALPSLKRLPARELDALLAPRKRRLAPVVWFAGAAAAAAAIVLFFTLRAPVALPRAERFVQAHSAPADAETRIALPDGSIAVLHRGSQIAFGDFPSSRLVRLLSGEAHFTVAKTSARPFVVHAGKVTVRDIGTAFNVRLDPDRVAVLVTQGSVAVSGQPLVLSLAGGPFSAPSELILTMGQQVIVENDASTAVEVRAPAAPEVAEALAWKSRRLSFDRTPLSEVVVGLNRYNVRQLVIADATIESVLIAGGVQSDNLDAFVRLLDSGFGITAEQRGGEIILHKAK